MESGLCGIVKIGSALTLWLCFYQGMETGMARWT
jgi:hypothetical protein